MTTLKKRLQDKLANVSARLGIVGMGYVGLPSAIAFAEVGFEVVGVDVDQNKVAQLNKGCSYIEDVSSDRLNELVRSGRFWASSEYKELRSVDVILICVPTPLRKTKDPDVSYIIEATKRIALEGGGGRGKLVVLESTTYPGTTEELILPCLRENGDQAGEDFFLAFSPERIDPGRKDYTFRTTPKVVGGVTPNCLEVAVALYEKVIDQPVPISSTAAAEMVKLLENTFRAVNIGLVNEVALMCDKLGLDVWDIIEAASTKPYGFMKFTPGPGLGGHCIPVDPHYLSWKLRTLNYTARFIDLAAEVNGSMPRFVADRVADALNANFKPVNGSDVLLLGVAYKPNVGDVRESPALDIVHLLQDRGANVSYHDPYVSTLAREGFDLDSVRLTPKVLADADCVVIVTDHDWYDWQCIADYSSLVIDTRNALDGIAEQQSIIRI